MTLNELAAAAHNNAKEKGFYDNPLKVGELLMLAVSELGEAMEAHRKGNFCSDDAIELCERYGVENTFKATIKDTFEDEIADAVIRLLDFSAFLGIDIEKHVALKMEFNSTRPRLHGKKY